MTKLTRPEAQNEAKRLLSCPMLAPQSDEGRKEIVDCLMRNCQSAAHAETVMTRFLDSALKIEGAATALIASIARETQRSDQAPAGCPACEIGEDVTTGEMRWAFHVPGVRGGYSVAVRCGCVRGQWLKAREAEGRAKVPEPEPAPAPLSQFAADWARRAAGDRE